MIRNLFKKAFKIILNKLFWMILAALLQISIVIYLMNAFYDLYYLFAVGLVVVKVAFMLRIINSEIAPEYKNVWLITLLINTFSGVVLYFFFGRIKLGANTKMKLQYINMTLKERTRNYPGELPEDDTARHVCEYLKSSCNSAAFSGNHCEYFPVGEKFFEKLFTELKKAQNYIYLDYFIIEDGKIWDKLFKVLGERINAGVDVRLIYDDVGSVLKINRVFAKKLADSKIKIRAFNRISPTLSSKQNNRDHRKVCIIDGSVCFIGGINLSDEYANIKKPFGYWKDTAVMISGRAVEVFTNEFLACYDGYFGDSLTFSEFSCSSVPVFEERGIVAPYFDSPFENKQVCRDIYVDLIRNASESICITTPYFVPDYSVETALKNALLRGVSVRIILPGIYDKWYVRELSRMYALRMEKYGAEVFEYTPGFLHQKMLICDGKYVVCGSSNLDFRSFYLSFESGVFMYDTEIIEDIKLDFESMLEKSRPFFESLEKAHALSWLFRHTFAIFSPLV